MNYKIGIITGLEVKRCGDKIKKIITIKCDDDDYLKEVLFIEFQSRFINCLKNRKINDKVKIGFLFNGKTSKTGIDHNNLIGRSINKI